MVVVQRRGCHVAINGGRLLILSRPDVPLAPNALAVDVPARVALEGQGFRGGQVVSLGRRVPLYREADWLVPLETASIWEPRPRIAPISPADLVERARTTRATVVAEGAGESLLPL